MAGLGTSSAAPYRAVRAGRQQKALAACSKARASWEPQPGYPHAGKVSWFKLSSSTLISHTRDFSSRLCVPSGHQPKSRLPTGGNGAGGGQGMGNLLPWVPPQLKLLQPVALGARARDGVGMRHCGWDPGSRRCRFCLLLSWGGQAGRVPSVGRQGPGTVVGGSPRAPPSTGVLEHRSPAALPPHVPCPPPRLVAIVISNTTQRYERLKVASFPARLNRSPGMSIIPTSQLSPSRYVSRGHAWHYMKVKGIQ